MKIAVFPGSFDPFTLGHYHIVEKGLKIFDKIIIGIGNNSNKYGLFSVEERKKLIEQVYQFNNNVEVDIFENMTGDFCKKVGANFILRGVRNSSDFEYENNIAQINKQLFPKILTTIVFSDPEYSAISSSVVREMIKYNKNIRSFVPMLLANYYYSRLHKQKTLQLCQK